MLPPTERFSSRVENYVRYRPSYPVDVVGLLGERCGLASGSDVADVGSGTGIFTRLLLPIGCRVFAVEPNAGMRQAAEASTNGEKFISVDGTAEATTLPNACVDLIVCAQAFHWFANDRARTEFTRILRPGGWVALVWNERLSHGTPFLEGYERMLTELSADYTQVNHANFDAHSLASFFEPQEMHRATFSNAQSFDLNGLVGRVLSSSYAPEPGHPDHEPMMRELRRLFDAHQENGEVAFLYRTEVYFGQLE